MSTLYGKIIDRHSGRSLEARVNVLASTGQFHHPGLHPGHRRHLKRGGATLLGVGQDQNSRFVHFRQVIQCVRYRPQLLAVVSTEAFRPLDQGNCPLVKKG